MAWLTWKAAFRFRLFWVLTALLLAVVVGLPILIKDDGTARGFTQILLTYTLSAITALLGLCTLWLACGTLARDIEECQMQVVAVKPVPRWKIWLGKWLGIMSLNTVVLAVAGASVFALLQWRATRLPADERAKLRNEVLVARGSAREPVPLQEIEAEAARRLRERLERNPVARVDLPEVKRQILEQVRAELQLVAPGTYRPWQIDLRHAKNRLRDQPLYLRIKFNTADPYPTGTFLALWQVGDPTTGRLWRSEIMSLAPDTFHEIEIPPNLLDDEGFLNVFFINPPANTVPLLFPLEEGLEVLYREGGFAVNYARGLGIILCWLALLATLGLTAASFLSFPVAAFASLAVLTMALSSGTLANVVSEGTLMGVNEETGKVGYSILDRVFVPTFKVLLQIIRLARDFSPIDALSTGRSIPWGMLGRAYAQIVLLMSGCLALLGIGIFTRRELATAQGTL